MKRLTIYPYTQAYDFFSKYSFMLKEYEELALVCVNSVESVKKDGCKIIDDLTKAINEADDILLLAGLNDSSVYNRIISEYKDKKIFIERQLYGVVDKNLLCNITKLSNQHTFTFTENAFYDIEIPVISIMSMGYDSGKFALQLSLRDFFEKKDYKVLQYGSKDISELFGFSSLPEFLFDDISFTSKVLRLNQMIYKDATESDPDLIIIGAPGGVMPYNKYVHNYFGEIPLVISKALQIDVNIISMYFMENADNNIDKYLNTLNPFCKETFGCEINIFNFSNSYMCYNREMKKEEYFYLNEKKIIESNPISNKHIVLCDCFDINKENTFSHIENLLKSSFEQI